MHVVSWLGAHWAAISVVIASLMSLVGTIKNALDDGKHATAETWLGRVLDVMAWVSKYGKLSFPGLPSPAPGSIEDR